MNKKNQAPVYQLFREEEELVDFKIANEHGIIESIPIPIYYRSLIANPIDPGGDNLMTLNLAMTLVKKLPWRIWYLNYILFNTNTKEIKYLDSNGVEIIKEI